MKEKPKKDWVFDNRVLQDVSTVEKIRSILKKCRLEMEDAEDEQKLTLLDQGFTSVTEVAEAEADRLNKSHYKEKAFLTQAVRKIEDFLGTRTTDRCELNENQGGTIHGKSSCIMYYTVLCIIQYYY